MNKDNVGITSYHHYTDDPSRWVIARTTGSGLGESLVRPEDVPFDERVRLWSHLIMAGWDKGVLVRYGIRRITGHEAIAYAIQSGQILSKYSDPTEEARISLTVAEAQDICAEDPSLIYLHIPL